MNLGFLDFINQINDNNNKELGLVITFKILIIALHINNNSNIRPILIVKSSVLDILIQSKILFCKIL